MKCSLCSETGICANKVIKCAGCGLKVHILCYGIKTDQYADGNTAVKWKCSPCQRGILEPIVCELCHQPNGAFKQTVCGKWVHVICALFTDGVQFDNAIEMEPIHITNVLNSKRQQKTCAFCLRSVGICRSCSKSTCKHWVHINCAQFNNCLDVIASDKNDSVKYRAYCMDHKPKDSVRSMSSATIQKMLSKRMKKTQEKRPSAKFQMDAAERLAIENMSFEIEPSETEPCENTDKSIIQQKTRINHVNELPSGGRPSTPHIGAMRPSNATRFSIFDSFDGKKQHYTAQYSLSSDEIQYDLYVCGL